MGQQVGGRGDFFYKLGFGIGFELIVLDEVLYKLQALDETVAISQVDIKTGRHWGPCRNALKQVDDILVKRLKILKFSFYLIKREI